MTEEYPPNLLYYPPTEDHLERLASPVKESFGTQLKTLFFRKYPPGPWRYAIEQVFPVIKVIKQLRKEHSFQGLVADILAGLTASTLLIPQSLSYATLAQLSPEYGLFTGIMGCFCYFIFGTCRETSLGPFALVSLMMSQTINNLYPELADLELTDPSEAFHLRLVYTFSLTFVSGVQLLLLAALKLGWCIDLFSSPSLAAFLQGAAFAVSATQIGALCGVKTIQQSFLVTVISFFRNFTSTVNWFSMLIGILALVIVCCSDIYSAKKKFAIPIPSQIILVTISIIFSAIFKFHDNFDVKIIGSIQSGFPMPTIPSFSTIFTDLRYWTSAIPITISSFVVLCSISAQLQEKHRNDYRVNFNSEILSLAVSSVLGSFLNAYPSSAAYSRTSVIDACKPKTSLHNLATFFTLILVIFVMGPLVYHLPLTILAAIVIASFRKSLFDWEQGVNIWKADFGEGLVYYGTFFATICVGIDAGVYASLICSVGYNIVTQASFSTTSFLRAVPHTQRFVPHQRVEGGEMGLYYSYLTSIEDKGGIYKIRACEESESLTHRPARSKKSNKTKSNDDPDGDDRNVLDDHVDDSSDQYHEFHDVNSPASPRPPRNPSSPKTDTDFLYDSDVPSPHDDGIEAFTLRHLQNHSLPTHVSLTSLPSICSTEDSRVVTMYVGEPITHLNASPINDYILRYIEMHEAYQKSREKLSQASNALEHSAAPLDSGISKTSTPQGSLVSQSNQPSRETTLKSLFPLAPSHLKPTIQALNNANSPTTNPQPLEDIDANPFHQHVSSGTRNRSHSSTSNSSHRSLGSIDALSEAGSLTPSTISQIPWKLPISKLLSNQQQHLLAALVEYTLDKVTDARLNQYEFVIILDFVSRIDITAFKLLQGLLKTYPKLLILFTSPGQKLITTLSSRCSIPSGFVFDSIFTASEFSRCLLQIAEDGRALESYNKQMQSSQAPFSDAEDQV